MKLIIVFVLAVIVVLAIIYAGGSLLVGCYDAEITAHSEPAVR